MMKFVFLLIQFLDEEMPEYQQAAWVMAVYFQGMSAQETAFFTEEMMLSGEVIEMSMFPVRKLKSIQRVVWETKPLSTRTFSRCSRCGNALNEWR